MELRERALLISSMAHAYCHACMLSVPPLVLLLRDEFTLSFVMVSLIITCSGLLFGLGAIPFGRLSDRYGPVAVNMVGIGISCAACTGMYLAPSASAMAASLLALGVGASTYHPSAFTLISCSYDSCVGRAFGINGLIGSVGQIGAPVLSAFVAYTAGWRPVFGVLLVIGVAMLAILSTVRHLDKDVRREPAPVRTRLRLDRDIALLFGITMLGGLAYRGVTTMLPSYATIMFGKNTLEAGSMVTIMLAAGGVSQVVAGEIHDRFGARRPLAVTCIASLASIGIVMAGPYQLFIGGLVAFGFAYFAVNLYSNALMGHLTPPEQRGMYYGIMFFARFGLGFLAPFLIGAVTEAYSIGYLFHVVGAFQLAYVLVALALLRSTHQVP